MGQGGLDLDSLGSDDRVASGIPIWDLAGRFYLPIIHSVIVFM